MHLNILSKAPRVVSDDEVYRAIAIEVAIINHCRANISHNSSFERNKKLAETEETAIARYEILMEMVN